MSKELEALHTIAFNTQINGMNFGDELRTIEKALQRLEAIDNANPSEALEELEQDIKNRVILAEDKQLKLCAVIKQALLKAQEQEKVLEIIKEKYVEFYILLKSKNVEHYNSNTKFGKELTEEEFDLLKRYFEWKHQ